MKCKVFPIQALLDVLPYEVLLSSTESINTGALQSLEVNSFDCICILETQTEGVF